RLEIGPDAVVITHGSDRRTLARSEITGVHRDGGKVHIDGREGRVLFAKKVEASKDAVREAFTAHGYPYESD
ncbi:YqeB family protein, partial [Nocardioides massiliensis]